MRSATARLRPSVSSDLRLFGQRFGEQESRLLIARNLFHETAIGNRGIDGLFEQGQVAQTSGVIVVFLALIESRFHVRPRDDRQDVLNLNFLSNVVVEYDREPGCPRPALRYTA